MSPTHAQIRAKNQRKAQKTHIPYPQPELAADREFAPTIESYLRLTRDADPTVRNQAVQQLCPCKVKANYAAVWDCVLAMVADEDAKVRSTVLHTLCDGSPHEREAEVVTAVERFYHDPDRKVRRQARKVLSHYRRTGRINIL